MTRIDVDEWYDEHGEIRMTPEQFRIEEVRVAEEDEDDWDWGDDEADD